MSKPFDYYAGYPGQRKTPKWIGVVLGSLFGAMALIVVAIGVRLLVPARVAQASVAKPLAAAPSVDPVVDPVAAPAAATPASPVAVAGEPSVDAVPPRAHKRHGHGSAGKHGKGARSVVVAKAAPLKETKQYKRAQVFAKTVASGSKRDRKARAELDRMLGL